MKKLAIHFSYHLALLLIIPITFTGIYVWAYFNPPIVIYQHLSVISLIIFCVLSIKLLLNHYLYNRKLIIFVGTILYSSFFFGVIVYYFLVLISLHSWNRVITEEFIVSYANQAHFFLDAIGISYYLVIVTLIIFYTLLTIACYYFLRKFHWLPTKQHNTTWLIGPLMLSALLLCSYHLNDYLISGDISSKEPLKLTLHSGKPKGEQIHEAKLGYKSNKQINITENNARKNGGFKVEVQKVQHDAA